jgi:hypothetical protein
LLFWNFDWRRRLDFLPNTDSIRGKRLEAECIRFVAGQRGFVVRRGSCGCRIGLLGEVEKTRLLKWQGRFPQHANRRKQFNHDDKPHGVPGGRARPEATAHDENDDRERGGGNGIPQQYLEHGRHLPFFRGRSISS